MSPIPLWLCHVHRTRDQKKIDYFSLGRTHFQGPALLGSLHSVDITRRIGSLICSSLTLNVIYTGQLVVWTFIVRETFVTIIIQSNHTKRYSTEGAICKESLRTCLACYCRGRSWMEMLPLFFTHCTRMHHYAVCMIWGWKKLYHIN